MLSILKQYFNTVQSTPVTSAFTPNRLFLLCYDVFVLFEDHWRANRTTVDGPRGGRPSKHRKSTSREFFPRRVVYEHARNRQRDHRAHVHLSPNTFRSSMKYDRCPRCLKRPFRRRRHFYFPRWFIATTGRAFLSVQQWYVRVLDPNGRRALCGGRASTSARWHGPKPTAAGGGDDVRVAVVVTFSPPAARTYVRGSSDASRLPATVLFLVPVSRPSAPRRGRATACSSVPLRARRGVPPPPFHRVDRNSGWVFIFLLYLIFLF